MQTLPTEQKQNRFNKKLQDINRQMEEDQAAERAHGLNLQYVNLHQFPIDLSALGMWSKEQSEDARAVIFFKDGSDLRIGALDPQSPLLKKMMVQLQEQKFKPKAYYISQGSFDQAMEMFERVVRPQEDKSDIVEVKSSDDHIEALKKLGTTKDALTPTQTLGTILGAATKYGASDIHIEPQDEHLRIRLRLDGVLTDVLHLKKEEQKPLISRIKILSKLKLNVEDEPQDGRFTYSLDGNLIDVRVSSLPSAYGEAVVMRLLDNKEVSLKLDDLGFNGKAYERIKQEIAKPNGMVITTGPTGSGKTTTLYAFLNQLNEPGVNVITLEDPIEYKLAGINQTPIKNGLSFASALRSVLRQDPDIVMVGEIRDRETADVALQASLTGHLVLSTLHTNDAAGAIPRLINMGVKPFVIAPGLNAIIAQRLVRKICQFCKKETKLDPFLYDRVSKIMKEIPAAAEVSVPEELKFYHSGGCEKCNGFGYKGRIGIFEVLFKSDELDKLIMNNASTADIKQHAIQSGMVTMVQDGILKALKGITDVEEVFRVAQD